ncbi:hypothetical protein GCM10029976_063010 [Kribbella albertanoniae]
MSATALAAINVPSPSATSTNITEAPNVFPSIVSTASRRPTANARPTMNNTLGPGTTMITNAVIANARRC